MTKIDDIKKSIRFLYIKKSIRFLDIKKSIQFLDIKNRFIDIKKWISLNHKMKF